MTRKIPIVPTIFVVAAVATMIGLGVWQLRRAAWKEGLIADYANAATLPPLEWPAADANPLPLFRRAEGDCAGPVVRRTAPGQNQTGEAGYAFVADCASGGSVAIGWSKNPNAKVAWPGGRVSGTIAPDPKSGTRLVMDGAADGLQPLAPPSLDTIPNNHRFYAVQWFFFAAAALVIYGLALRSKWIDRP